MSVDDHPVDSVLASTTERTACSATHGDAFPQNIPLTTVPAGASTALKLQAGDGATEIRGAIYDVDAPPGAPLEEFTLAARSGTYQPRRFVTGHTYQVLVNVVWSFVVTGGEETRLFRLRLEAP